MRNSEESSTTQPAPSSLEKCGAGAAQTSGGLSLLIPHGRVGAEIVCENTLVQYAAYLGLAFPSGLVRFGIIQFRSFWWGRRFTSIFFRSVFVYFSL
ncbi:hypothetical protein N7448_002997 [Penicillium atrosanguineum]|nr:hypothetical protein N7448_002997 [Penicillium atrosanguineum]